MEAYAGESGCGSGSGSAAVSALSAAPDSAGGADCTTVRFDASLLSVLTPGANVKRLPLCPAPRAAGAEGRCGLPLPATGSAASGAGCAAVATGWVSVGGAAAPGLAGGVSVPDDASAVGGALGGAGAAAWAA